MRELVSPIHIGTLNEKPLRFFKAPTDEPDLMWHSLDDLVASANLPSDLRRYFKYKLQKKWRSETKNVATPQDIITIASHFIAVNLINVMIENKYFPASIEMSYIVQSGDAWNALMAKFPEWARMELLLAACRSSNNSDRNRSGA